jgi:hypothetical protein
MNIPILISLVIILALLAYNTYSGTLQLFDIRGALRIALFSLLSASVYLIVKEALILLFGTDPSHLGANLTSVLLFIAKILFTLGIVWLLITLSNVLHKSLFAKGSE